MPGFGGHVLRFAAIGVVSMLAYARLQVLFRTALPAQAANALALLATAIGNTAANRRLTFAIRGAGAGSATRRRVSSSPASPSP